MASTTAAQETIAIPDRKGKWKRIALIVLIALVAAGAAAGGMYFFLSKNPGKVAVRPPAPPVFVPLEPMTVNLLSDDSDHYLRVGLTLKLADDKMQAHLSDHMPEIRSRILLALSNKHPEDLETLDGKRALAKELIGLIEQPTDAGAPAIHVEDVLFTDFVVQ